MEDIEIIELYNKRSEKAIAESNCKYGKYCTSIAYNILFNHEDSEECVSDTWLRAWNAIPPAVPKILSAYFGRITRHLAIDRYRKNKSNGGNMAICLDELAECVGTDETPESLTVTKDSINRFLDSLKEQNRKIFLLRYWYMYSICEIAERCNVSEGTVKMSLKRTREALTVFLEREVDNV